ncbi:putative domain HDIG-containing protein [Desulfocurvibacter africanus PCS]|uniref:Putative domain HDIG-containing protein n=1 Tax=Desulfocurvibacter africanus PCS TaxID=1262666 RepID=M5PT89_DESAF|nr:HDOD domain-containing protein [Desulfocurvibacter africanus]EMG37265.1 putative domain HDIG-containing protein [Desulfocurvibacter africanus PCS]
MKSNVTDRGDAALSKDISTRITKLRPLSKSAMRLMQIVGEEDYGLGDITRIVEHDAALTANVLKVANSPALGLRHKVDSLGRAVTYLGDKMVVGIAIAASSPEVFDSELPGYVGERGELWLHCLHAAMASREVSKRARQPVSPELAFTAGILHDMGKVVLSDFLDGQDLVRLLQKNGGDFLAVERELTGTNHAEVGLALARHWNLPDVLCNAIALHHNPEKALPADKPLVHAVHLGDAIAMLGGTGTGADAMGYSLSTESLRLFALDEGELERIILDVSLEFTAARSFLACPAG